MRHGVQEASRPPDFKFVMEVNKLVASNNPLILDDGNGQTVAVLSDSRNVIIDGQGAEKRVSGIQDQTVKASRAQREAGDQVNRYLLCALVSESAKLIKASAEKIGESLPMTMIVRGVLRSYRQAAKDRNEALAEPELNMASLRTLNKKVLRDEVARHSRDRVRDSERQLAHAKKLGDDTRIKSVKDGLEHAIELRDRLAKKFS